MSEARTDILPEFVSAAQAIAWAMWRKPVSQLNVEHFDALTAQVRYGGHVSVSPRAYADIVQKLGSGKLVAYARDATGQSVTIEPVEWSRIELWAEPWRHRPYVDIKFRRSDLLRLWPPVTYGKRGAPTEFDWQAVEIWAREAFEKHPSIGIGKLADSLVSDYAQRIGKPPHKDTIRRKLSDWNIPPT